MNRFIILCVALACSFAAFVASFTFIAMAPPTANVNSSIYMMLGSVAAMIAVRQLMAR